MSNFEKNTRTALQTERVAAKGQTKDGGATQELYMAVVTEANGGGYDVSALSSSGTPAGYYSRVFTWPAEATLTAGEMVWLWQSPGEEPVILVAGGGGTCYGAVTGWGVMR